MPIRILLAAEASSAKSATRARSAVRRVVVSAMLSIGLVAHGAADTGRAAPEAAPSSISETIQRFAVAEGISVEDAVASMQLRANMLNFKQVADLPLSEQVKSMGEDARYMRILAFCDALIAKRMVEHSLAFAGFLPCRIAVVKDAAGKAWIVTLNMDAMLRAADLPPELQPLARRVRDAIYSIVQAGVHGEL